MSESSSLRWQQVAADLRERIASGALTPGARLPGRPGLMAEFEVSDRTVLSALAQLQREGLIYPRPSSGWYIRAPRSVIRLGRHRLSRAEREAGRGTFGTDCHAAGLTADSETAVTAGAAPEHVAAVLGIEPGAPVVVRDRVMRGDGDVLQLATSYLPAELAEVAPAIAEQDSGPGGIYARLDEAGVTLTSYVETVAIGRADEHEARQMGLPPGDPLYRVERVAWASDRAVELNLITITGDRVVLTYEQAAE